MTLFIDVLLSYHDNDYSVDVALLNGWMDERGLCLGKWKIKISTYFKTEAGEI